MRVIVTRPEREAGRWVDRLLERGFSAEALPLIEIGEAPDAGPLQEAWRSLADHAAVMFVSSNAVAHFFKQKVLLTHMEWAQHAPKTRAWAPGPGTQAALVAAGVDPALIDAPPADAGQFDSEALWQRVGPQVRAGDRVLIVRGADGRGQGTGRDWLASRLLAHGALPQAVVAYVRQRPVWNTRQLAQATTAAGDGAAWLFSSSEAIVNLQALLPGRDWRRARAVATHPRIAQTARNAGFGVVCPSRPALEDVASALESIR